MFYNFFPYFSGGVHSRPRRFFWQQYGSNWTLHYAAADKNHRGILCHKISCSDITAMQERFRKEQCTWKKDNCTFGGKISVDRKCDRYPQRSTSFIVWYNSWEYSKFTGTPGGIPRKINTSPLTRNCYFKNICLRILHDDVKLFPYKIQIFRRQISQNKAEGETFCKDIHQ